jgi:V8-like Glu-specific endopeptidase
MPSTYWFNILTAAAGEELLNDVVAAALRRFPKDPLLQSAAKGDLNGVRGADIATDVTWHGPEKPSALEKIIGERSTLLPISFLEEGMARARAVVRILLPGDGNSAPASGSGFLSESGLVITNHHVLADGDAARRAIIQFNYQQTPDGLDVQPHEARLDVNGGFATSKEDDWSAVRIAGDAVALAAAWGGLPLRPAVTQKQDAINIIQHPGGGPKQIALYHNVVVYSDARVVQYLTDTLPGSSGSPCFNDAWEVVALHHSGGWLREPGGKEAYFRNEGIAIGAVIAGLQNAQLL